MHKGKSLSEKIYKKLKQREDITGNENCIVFIELRKFVYETFFLYFSQDFKEQIHQQGPPVSNALPDMVTSVSRSPTCSVVVRVSISPLPEASAFDTRFLFAFLAFSRLERTWHCCFDLGGVNVGTLEANKRYNYTFSLSRTNFAATSREDM